MRQWRWLSGPVLVIALAAAGVPARALPLDPGSCGQLDKERVALEAAGVLADVRLQAQEIKTLPKDRLQRMQRYVDVSGQVLFRCQSLLPPVGPQTVAGEGATPAATKIAVVPPASAKGKGKGAHTKRKH